ncbi:hypothetical protein GCM10023310_70160 [Paenibacillus vulneris]|uniref:Uncharacterized protein n=1 Tax=Paenibacillus vulneris TaxID=1133364 RepID=A0ABW3UH21_9BACL
MNIPFGYKMVDGKLVVDEYQSKIVNLMNELFLLELSQDGIKVSIDSNDIAHVMLKFNVPKTQIEGYEIEDHKQEILAYCQEILKEKLATKFEQFKKDSQ